MNTDAIEHIILGVVTAALGVSVRFYLAVRQQLTAPERLEEHARRAIEYARSRNAQGRELSRIAYEASVKLDRDANGKQDWTDAQHRIAVDALLSRAASAATR